MSIRKHKMLVDGAKLAQARIDAGLSILQVSIALNDGCNKGSVSRWEQGKLNPSEVRILKMAGLFGTTSFIIKGNTEEGQ